MSQPLPIFTGTQVKYFAFCHRRLWLFSHNIEMEQESQDVQIGQIVGDKSYGRERKEVNIDNRIVIDWVESKVLADGTLLIHETKKVARLIARIACKCCFTYFIFRPKA